MTQNDADEILHERIGPWAVTRWPEIRHHLAEQCASCGPLDHPELDDLARDGAILMFSNGTFVCVVAETPRQVKALKTMGTDRVIPRTALEHVLQLQGYDRTALQPLRLYDVLRRVLEIAR